jgi:hypothetical protein
MRVSTAAMETIDGDLMEERLQVAVILGEAFDQAVEGSDGDDMICWFYSD